MRGVRVPGNHNAKPRALRAGDGGWAVMKAAKAAAFAGLMVIAGCGPLADDRHKPVKDRLKYEQSSSIKRVRNDLYEYTPEATNPVRDTPRDDNYRVTSDPPTSFEFPRQYHMWDVNHKGGAVTAVGLLLNRRTWGPMGAELIRRRRAMVARFRDRPVNVRLRAVTAFDRAMDRETIEATLYANRIGAAPPPGRSRSMRDGERIISQGLEITIYTQKERRAYTRSFIKEPVEFAGIDLAGLEFEAIPLAASDPAKTIDCAEFGIKCEVRARYRGRELLVFIYRDDLNNYQIILNNVINIFDEHCINCASPKD